MDNACRYAAQAGEGGRVRVSVTVATNRVSLAVEDSGPGIPEEERPTLFDRFRRVTEDGQGAGLGLAIADSIVRSTGGRWNVGGSARLGGARLEVSWRRHQPRQARGSRSAPGPHRPKPPP
jgi:signal transduction histidine kinase